MWHCDDVVELLEIWHRVKCVLWLNDRQVPESVNAVNYQIVFQLAEMGLDKARILSRNAFQ